MSKFKIVGMMALTAFAMGIVLVGDAFAQQKTLKEQLVGTWTLVSATQKGIIIYDANGRYAQIQLNPDRPKFKGKTRLDGTPEENKAVLQSTSASFGTWSVNEADKSFVQHVEFHIFPNDDGREVKFSITLTGDELKYINTRASAGGTAEAVYKRAK